MASSELRGSPVRPCVLLVAALLLLSGGPRSQEGIPGDSSAAARDLSVDDLVAAMRAKERSVRSVRIRMRTTKRLFNGGTLRVSGTIEAMTRTAAAGRSARNYVHVQTSVEALEDGLVARSTLLRTPAGVWLRDRDPVQGDVFLTMTPELVRELEEASKILDRAVSPGTLVPTDAGLGVAAPLGSAVLEELAANYTLTVTSRTIDSTDVYVVSGPSRAAPSEIEQLGVPDHVEVLVRRLDLVASRVRELRAGEKLSEIVIESVELDPLIELQAFEPDAVFNDLAGREPLDAMKHPTTSRMIKRIRADVEAKRQRGTEEPRTPGSAGGSDPSGR